MKVFNRLAAAALATALGLASPVATSGVGADGTKSAASVSIVGRDSWRVGRVENTYHFANDTVTVASGGTITWDNTTNDGHTISIIAAADLPTSFDCPVCDMVNEVYFPDPNGPPAGLSIDEGVIKDTAVTPTVPTFASFSSASHSAGGGVVGDSMLIDAAGSNNQGGPTSRSATITAPAGTVLRYGCTFHDWMQGTIRVVEAHGNQ